MINESLFQVPASVEDPDVLKRFLDRLVERLDIVLGYRGDNPYAATTDLTTAVDALTQEAEQIATKLVEETDSLNEQLLTLVAQLEEQLQKLASLLSRVETLEAEVSDILLELTVLSARLDALEADYAALDIRVDDLEATTEMLTSYSTTLIRDFNSAAWQTAPIYTKFTALGSAILNAPGSSTVDDIDLDDTYGIVTDIIETSVGLNPASTYTCYIEVRAAYVQKVIIVGTGFAISKSRAGSTWAELVANAWV